MVQTSLDFAKQSYASIKQKISTGLSTNQSTLVLSSEAHFNNPNPGDEEPAIEAAYAHIGTLEAFRHAVGDNNIEKIKLAIELNQDTLEDIIATISEHIDVPYGLKDFPAAYAIKYVLDLNKKLNADIEIVAIDTYPHHGELFGAIANARELVKRNNLIAIAEGSPGVKCLYIGGSEHQATMQGIENRVILANMGSVVADQKSNPFMRAYSGGVYYINSDRLNEKEMKMIENNTSFAAIFLAAQSNYFTNPANALQIDAPKGLDYSTGNFIRDINIAASSIEAKALHNSNIASSSLTFNPIMQAIAGYPANAQRAVLENIHATSVSRATMIPGTSNNER